VRGARLPSGAENVVATYRSGLGAEGEVEAGQLALLKTKPLGMREVNNPLPASGAEPPETEAETRENAPRTVLVLGRVVSIQDYEDFSKTFPGVGKAKAVPMWDGFSRFVHLTIGTEGSAPIERGTPLYQSLLGALDNVRDTHQLVTIEGYEDIYFGVHARVLVDPRYEPEPVLAAVSIELQRAFSYHAREFGQDVTAAEIVAIIHSVAGVVAVDIDALYRTTPPQELLEARLARLENGVLKRAELLLIDPKHIRLEPMT
jgi:predicted phage baseplate assembly protein